MQFYPDGKHQLEMITSAALKAGFSGGLVVDYPNSTKAKKYFLVIEAGARRNLAIV
jgi:18S rRNA (guanine1575-N7)-methyltransferase